MMGDPVWQSFLQTEAQVRFVAFGGHRLRVVELGAGDPLLLVHGFADSAYTWHRNVRPLAEAGFRVLAYDYPGCGESALPDGFRFGVDNLARLAIGVLDELGIERAHLVGNSMGGGIGLHLAVHSPHRLRRVVLESPTCYHPPFRPLIFFPRWPPLNRLSQEVSGPWLAEWILRSMYVDCTLLTPEVLAQYRLAFRRPDYLVACAGLLRDYWNRAFYATARQYADIRLPLHLVWGDRDLWVFAQQYAHRLADDTGADLTLISGVGHMVHQARPDDFNPVVIRSLLEE